MSGQAWFVRVNEFFLRNNFPRFFTDFVYAVITPKSHKEDLEARTAHIVEVSTRHQSALTRIVKDNPSLAIWTSEEKLSLLPGRQFSVGLAFSHMEEMYDTEYIVKIFNEFVIDDRVFVAVVHYYATIWAFFERKGWFDPKTGTLSPECEEDATRIAASQLLDKELASALIAAGPKEWTYDEIYKKLSTTI